MTARKNRVSPADVARLRAGPKPAVRRNGKPEAALQKAILARLELMHCWCWRNNAGMMVVGTGAARRVVKLSPVGSPDIFIVLPSGRLAGLECKAPGKKQTAAQAAWQLRAENHHVMYRVVYSVAEAVAAVREWEGRS